MPHASPTVNAVTDQAAASMSVAPVSSTIAQGTSQAQPAVQSATLPSAQQNKGQQNTSPNKGRGNNNNKRKFQLPTNARSSEFSTSNLRWRNVDGTANAASNT